MIVEDKSVVANAAGICMQIKLTAGFVMGLGGGDTCMGQKFGQVWCDSGHVCARMSVTRGRVDRR